MINIEKCLKIDEKYVNINRKLVILVGLDRIFVLCPAELRNLFDVAAQRNYM